MADVLTLDLTQRILNVHWDAGKEFLITGAISTFTGKVQSSLEAFIWTDVPLLAGKILAATYGDGYWIVMGNPSGVVVNVVQFWRSTDLKTWSLMHSAEGSVPSFGSGAWGKPKDAKDELGKPPKLGVFVFVTNVGVRYTSRNAGATWTVEDLAPNQEDSLLGNVTFHNGAFFIGVKGKQVLTSNNTPIGDPHAYILRSTTGIGWIKSSALFSGQPFVDVPNTFGMVFPNGALYVMYLKKIVPGGDPFEKYVAVGFTNIDVSEVADPDVTLRRVLAIATSSNGVTWSDAAFINQHGPLDGGVGCAGKDAFVVPVVTYKSSTTSFAPSASIGRSTNGSGWSFTVPSGGSGSLDHAVNLEGGIAFSPTISPVGETVGLPFGMFVAAGRAGDDGYLLASPTGTAWAQVPNSFIGAAQIMCVATGKIPVT